MLLVRIIRTVAKQLLNLLLLLETVDFEIKNLKGYIAQEQLPSPYDVGANVSYISTDGSIVPIASAVVDTVAFAAAAGSNPAVWTVTITGATMPALAVDD